MVTSAIRDATISPVFSNSRSQIQDSNGKEFSIVPATSQEDLLNELPLDNRVTLNDTLDRRSCFRGLALDSEYTRSQVFVIKDNAKPIGIATLICIPYKNFDKHGYIKLENHELVFKSYQELGMHNPNSFIITIGWFFILPEYRGKKLGSNIFTNFLIPQIKILIQEASADLFIIVSAQGTADDQLKRKITNAWKTRSQNNIALLEETADKLGKVATHAMFTVATAKKMGLLPETDLFSLNLGPVFIKKLSRDFEDHT